MLMDQITDLTFIGTDPTYSRRGAGHMLLQWGIQQSDESDSPLYLESTIEAAPFCKENGLTAGETISLPIHVGGGSEMRVYEEVVFTYSAKFQHIYEAAV